MNKSDQSGNLRTSTKARAGMGPRPACTGRRISSHHLWCREPQLTFLPLLRLHRWAWQQPGTEVIPRTCASSAGGVPLGQHPAACQSGSTDTAFRGAWRTGTLTAASMVAPGEARGTLPGVGVSGSAGPRGSRFRWPFRPMGRMRVPVKRSGLPSHGSEALRLLEHICAAWWTLSGGARALRPR